MFGETKPPFMSPSVPRFVKPVMYAAGTVNLTAGILSLAAPSTMADAFGMVIPQPIQFYYWAWLLVATFGIGYFMVGQNPYKHRGILVLGTLGKALVVLECILSVSRGDTTLVYNLPILVGDGSFTILFLLILRKMR
ncbi:MAG TPA: hypothetical protein DCR93_12255 [Cytophagales bacterium]|nr:hypothetical protein [Cytophagales bacterium]HAP60221.1 hypothetical protein [Cytophagales bacterium]